LVVSVYPTVPALLGITVVPTIVIDGTVLTPWFCGAEGLINPNTWFCLVVVADEKGE